MMAGVYVILKTISLSQALPSDNAFDLKYEGKKNPTEACLFYFLSHFKMENAVRVLLSPPSKNSFLKFLLTFCWVFAEHKY